MSWDVYEQSHKCYRKLRRRLTKEALAHLERKGLPVRDKSMSEIRKLIAAARASDKHRHA